MKTTIQIGKFGEDLLSRPEGREAFLVMRSYHIPKNFNGTVELNFDGVKVMTPSWLDEVVTGLKNDMHVEVKFLPSNNPTVTESIKAISE